MDTSEGEKLTIHICVGSSCYVRGSDQVAAQLQQLIEEAGLGNTIDLVGSFCMEHCSMGVTMRIGDDMFEGITPDSSGRFFSEQVLPRLDAMKGMPHVGDQHR